MSTDTGNPDGTETDVEDRARLERYREFRERSLLQLKGDPVHNVYGQITAMVDGDRTWRLVNEMRRLAQERNKVDETSQSATQNTVIADFMDTGYVAIQALAIRRLLEEKSKNPKGQIISLRRVLESVKGNRSLITREIYVCHDGLPYDPTAGADKAIDVARVNPDGFDWGPMTGPDAWDASVLRHEEFDRLSGVSAAKRGRRDMISQEYFAELEAKLQIPFFTALEEYANKFVAHSADERSRDEVAEDIEITMDGIAACHSSIILVFGALMSEVFYEGTHSPVAMRANPLKNLDKPWVATEQLGDLRKWWIRHMNGIEELVGVTSTGAADSL